MKFIPLSTCFPGKCGQIKTFCLLSSVVKYMNMNSSLKDCDLLRQAIHCFIFHFSTRFFRLSKYVKSHQTRSLRYLCTPYFLSFYYHFCSSRDIWVIDLISLVYHLWSSRLWNISWCHLYLRYTKSTRVWPFKFMISKNFITSVHLKWICGAYGN